LPSAKWDRRPSRDRYPLTQPTTSMSLSHRELLDHCVRMLEGFETGLQAVDSYCDSYVEHVDNFRQLTENDSTFLREVFSGIVRYRGVLDIVVDSFYCSDGKNALKSDHNLYLLLVYLCLFRLDELTMVHFRKFASAIASPAKIFKFFSFFLAEKNLQSYIRDEWSRQYDGVFVQTELMSPLLNWMPELQDWLKHFEKKLKPSSAGERRKKVTETKPFNITPPRPRAVPVPDEIPKLTKFSRPLPKSLYEQPKERTSLSLIKEENRKAAATRFKEMQTKPLRVADTSKSKKTLDRENTIIKAEESKLKFDSYKAKPAPDMSRQKHPVKLTTAAILREGLVFQKQEEEILKNLEKLEQGYRDDSSHFALEKQRREEEEAKELAEAERKHLAGLLAYEESILAKMRNKEKNAERVLEIKEESKQRMLQMLRDKERRDKELEEIIEGVMAGHERARDGKKKLTEYKQKMAQMVNEESRELMRQALEEAEEEMRRRMQLIHEIRVMESRPQGSNQKMVDLAETAGHGFLGEMSIAELRERLALLKADAKKEEEAKRDAIINEKQERERMLSQTLEKIHRHREIMTKTNAERLEEKREKHFEKPRSEDSGVKSLREQLEEKRKERLKAKEEHAITPSRESNNRLRVLNREKQKQHDARWKDLEDSREKTTRDIRAHGGGKEEKEKMSYAQLIFASSC